MTPEEFAKGFYIQKKSMLDSYFDSDSNSDVAVMIKELNINEEGKEKLREIINSTLRDSFYTVLLGLDGEAQIGNHQETYTLQDEEGNELSGGMIESFAYEYFHNNKFEAENSQADFIASLKYRTTEQGGRQTPTVSGYRSQIKFPVSEMQSSGQQIFIDRKLVFPGDSVNAEIKISAPDYFEDGLVEGMKFEFMEGPIIIGTGRIEHIINQKLKRPAGNTKK